MNLGEASVGWEKGSGMLELLSDIISYQPFSHVPVTHGIDSSHFVGSLLIPTMCKIMETWHKNRWESNKCFKAVGVDYI